MIVTGVSRVHCTLAIALIGTVGLTTLYVTASSPSNTIYTVFRSLQLHPDSTSNDASSIRILCLILTAPQHFFTRTKAVHETWGPRCDRHFFITEPSSANLTAEQSNFVRQLSIAPIKNITPGYGHLTQKSNLAFLFGYEKYYNDFDWFVKADDDTYMIVDHLKLFLSNQNASEPVTFGYNFNVHIPKGYHSGGAGYVLSRESLRRFHEAQQDPKSHCAKDGGSEDIEINKCLRGKGAYPGKATDNRNRELFHPLDFGTHFRGSFPNWLVQRAENLPRSGYDCCSDQTVSFHYVNPDNQYLMHFLLYKTQLNAVRGRTSIEKSNSSTQPVN